MNIVEVSNLKKDYKFSVKGKGLFKSKSKVVRAVNNISFSVGEGETIAFIGPNGAGKSTTIKMLTGILRVIFVFLVPSLLLGVVPVEIIKSFSLVKCLILLLFSVLWLILYLFGFFIDL